ncbi:response regulator transcription factor [Acidithiobacillus sp.]|uniref:response regulator transcription factor n=1 Tax=Acidithiobacillus sp. TaxID=1872118 RepID=UPI0025BC80BE|nr:response regulator transcription factor [Acidithiobacillus sp.]MCK9188747.1 response regulator transcription factor [Acidithiobacillus sp.]MCK9359711.1 response regulator transcription factor [Acidithiobacillus sp.]
MNARTNGKTIVAVEVALERAGGQVRRVTERPEAEQLMRYWDPEVFVLLGWSAAVGDWLRRQQLAFHQDDLPFLVVGSSAEEDHHEPNAVAALEVGAQAYIPVSLGLEILTAQVRGLLKKLRTHAPTRVGEEENLCIDLVSLRVWILGQEIHLPRRLFYLLYYFATHPDEVVSNDQIADILWGGKGAYLAPNTLVVKIYRLRKILESAGAKGWLETVHSFGYRFSPPKNA